VAAYRTTAPSAAAPITTAPRKIVSRSRRFGLGANIVRFFQRERWRPQSSLSRLHGRPLGVSTLPDGVIDLKQEDPSLTLALIVVFTASMAA
jgi:hypothetical protein